MPHELKTHDEEEHLVPMSTGMSITKHGTPRLLPAVDSSSITLSRRAVVDKRNVVSRTPQDTTSPPLSASRLLEAYFKGHNVKFINGNL
ncbi:hypothetical protein TWF679_005389 [Orbilia oligospora]|uniref:Uncharacterized protein n=1 Tax=Orbilia oligospora TaxID=2813651 RepID=A0A8H8VBZ1_ORBOL|nr:hypothetical protein TWF679_005389 [Orbilia oligospora]